MHSSDVNEVIQVTPGSDSDDSDDSFHDALDDRGQLEAIRKRADPLRNKMERLQGLHLTKKQRNFKKNIEGYHRDGVHQRCFLP